MVHDKQFKKGQIPWNKGTMKYEIIICAGCGKEVMTKKSRHQKYCTLGCYRENSPAWNKGIPIKSEQKEKLRKANVGKIPWNKGKVLKHLSGKNACNYKHGHYCNQINKTIAWKDWREKIFKRDNWTCQLCNIRGGKLEPHHIRKLSESPELMFETWNGITLCRDCHNTTKGKENKFIPLFTSIMGGD